MPKNETAKELITITAFWLLSAQLMLNVAPFEL
jgi:hypothetical protein